MGEAKQLTDTITQWLAPVLRASQRKNLAFLCCLAAFGLALLLLTKPSTPPPTAPARAPVSSPEDEPVSTAGSLAGELAGILGQIAGAGRVEVRLSFASSRVNEWEQNRRQNQRTVEDRTQDGGLQVTSEETVETTLALARKADGSESPIERSSAAPVVTGAIIVAEGARDPQIQTELARAASAFLGIGLHRVLVFPKSLGE